MHLMSPMLIDIPSENLDEDSEKSNSVGFSSGSGHDLAGNSILIGHFNL